MVIEVMFLYRIGYKDLVHFKSIDRVSTFVINETVIQIGDHHYWLWVCSEPVQIHIVI
jgi:hypothetical protein